MSIIDPKTDMIYGLSVREKDGQVFCDDGRKVVGWLYCDDCGAPVPVKLNKGGNPYYGCAECNNQHRPQSSISRTHFTNRMEKLTAKGVNDDSSNENNDKETHKQGEAETSGEAGQHDRIRNRGSSAESDTESASSGKPSGNIRIGMFG